MEQPSHKVEFESPLVVDGVEYRSIDDYVKAMQALKVSGGNIDMNKAAETAIRYGFTPGTAAHGQLLATGEQKLNDWSTGNFIGNLLAQIRNGGEQREEDKVENLYHDPDGYQRRKSNQNPPANRPPTVTVNRTTYSVRGSTAFDAINDARTNNPHPDKFPGRTTIDNTASPRDIETKVTNTRAGSFTATVTAVTVDVTTIITVSTPKWEGYNNAPASEQQVWDRWNNALVDHENGHVRIATQGATEIQQVVTGAIGTATGRTSQQAVNNASRNATTDVQRRTTQATDRVQQRHNEYDRNTDHRRGR